MNVGLGTSTNGALNTQLPLGASYDSYQLSIFVQIMDNDNGISYYTISNQLVVQANTSATESIFSAILNTDTSSSVLSTLNSGSPEASISTILTLSSVLNDLSLTDQSSLSSINK
jgi:hypothetical protein